MPSSRDPIAIDLCTAANAAGLADAALQRLQAGGGPGAKWLYPYDGTVFPRGLGAPLLMWDGPADAIYVHITATGFDYKACVKPTMNGQFGVHAWRSRPRRCPSRTASSATLAYNAASSRPRRFFTAATPSCRTARPSTLTLGRSSGSPSGRNAGNAGQWPGVDHCGGVTTAQKPAMHTSGSSGPMAGQQSAVVVQRSSRLAHIIFIGEQVPTGSTSSAACMMVQ